MSKELDEENCGMASCEEGNREMVEEVLPESMQNANKPQKRLIITKIVLENFKSYYGKHDIGPLHKYFTAVVGPNGSGKSNTIDALLFVFGARAKKMRLNKLAELIHNSAHHQNCERATVEVHFEDLDSSELTVPGSRLVFSRSVNRNSDSEYKINGEREKYEKIQEVLKQRGIDLDHNRFLILQGEVEKISQMKPKGNENETGLLEYIEEVVDTKKYISTLDDYDSQIANIENGKRAAYNQFSNVSKDYQELEPQALETKKILQTKIDFYFLSHLDSLYKLTSREAYIKKKQEVKAKLEENLKEIQLKLKPMQLQINAANEELEKFINASSQQKHKKAELESKIAQVPREIQSLQVKLDRLHDQEAFAKNQFDMRHQRLDQLRKEFRQSLEKERELLLQIEQLETNERAKVQARIDDMINAQNDKEQQIVEQKKKIADKLMPLERELNNAQAEHKVLSQDKAKLDQYIKEALESNNKDDIKVQNTNQRLASSQRKLQDTHQEIDQIKLKKAEVEKSVHELQAQINFASSKQEQLEDEEASVRRVLKQMQQKDRVLVELQIAQQRGQLKGIHGRLGDLGKIDRIYDVAISTACSLLDHIIVQTIQDAERCISFLRQNQIGVGRFLALEQCKQDGGFQFKAPNNSKRLIDLIHCENNQYQRAFYKALNDTLVVQNIEVGSDIAYNQQKRFRVVTMQGDLIEMSGTMSGGGKPRSGRMSFLPSNPAEQVEMNDPNKIYTQEDLDKVMNELKDVKQRRQQLKNQANSFQNTLSGLNQALELAANGISLLYQGIQDDAKTVKLLEDQISVRCLSLNDKVKEQKEAALKLDHILGSKDLTKMTQEVMLLKEQLYQLNSQLTLNQSPEFKQLNDKMREISFAIASFKKEIDQIPVQKAHLEQKEKEFMLETRDYEKVKSDIARERTGGMQKMLVLQSQEQELAKQLSQMKGEFERQTEQLEQKKKAILELTTKLEAAQDTVQDQVYEIEELGKEMRKREQEIEKLNEKIKIVKSKHKEYNDIIAQTNVQENPENEEEVKQGLESKRVKHDFKHFNMQQLLTQVPVDYPFDQESLSQLEHLRDEMKKMQQELDDKAKNEEFDGSLLLRFIEVKNNLQVKQQAYLASKNMYEDLRKQRNAIYTERITRFQAGVKAVSAKLQQIYKEMTRGGTAELEPVRQLDPFSDGLVLNVRPPGKSWKVLSNLSGGEKTLVSLSLVFALHQYKPSPLYFMDEIDAALDYKNVEMLAKYIKTKSMKCQFLIISLRNNMFQLADHLVGVYKTHETTKTVMMIPDLVQVKMEELALSS